MSKYISKRILITSFMTLMVCSQNVSASASSAAAAAAGGDEGDKPSKPLTIEDLPAEDLDKILSFLSNDKPTHVRAESTAHGASSSTTAAAAGAPSNSEEQAVKNCDSDIENFRATSGTLRDIANESVNSKGVLVTDSVKAMSLSDAPELLKTFRFDDLVVSGFPKVLMKEDGEPEQEIIGSLIVMGSQRDMASCKSAAEKHRKLTVRYVVNDLPELNNSETGAGGAAAAGASAPSDNDTAIVEPTETFRVQSLQALWDAELAQPDSIFAVMRASMSTLAPKVNEERQFDRIFAPFILNETDKAVASQLLNGLGDFVRLLYSLDDLEKIPFENLKKDLTFFYETGILSKFIKVTLDISTIREGQVLLNGNFKGCVRVLKETGVWEKCDYSSELMFLSALMCGVGEDVFVETVDLLKASGAWDSLTATNILCYIQMLSKLTNKDARKKHCAGLVAVHKAKQSYS